MLHLIALQVSYTTVAAFFSNLLDRLEGPSYSSALQVG